MTKWLSWLAFLACLAAVVYFLVASRQGRERARGIPSGKLIRHSGTELTEPTNFKVSTPDSPVLAFEAMGEKDRQPFFFLSGKGDVVDEPPALAGDHTPPKNYVFRSVGGELFVANVATPSDQYPLFLHDPKTGTQHEVARVPNPTGYDLRTKAVGSAGWVVLEVETLNEAGDKKRRLWKFAVVDIERALDGK